MKSLRDTSPIHLFASFNTPEHFLQNTIPTAHSGGVFVDLLAGTHPDLLEADRLDLVGRVAELRIAVEKPRLSFSVRGAITFATAYNAGMRYRRIGVEFFRYEELQTRYFLDLLKDYPGTQRTQEYRLRTRQRIPAHLRMEFTYREASAKPERSAILVRTRTEEIGFDGCSFRAVRTLPPGSTLEVRLFTPPTKPDFEKELTQPPQNFAGATRETPRIVNRTWSLPCTVQWLKIDELKSSTIGVEFQSIPAGLYAFVQTLQNALEDELIFAREPAYPSTVLAKKTTEKLLSP